MKALIDTNVLIDYLADRAPFADHAEKIIDLCEQKTINGFVTASAVTDIYYILRKLSTRDVALEGIQLLSSVLGIADVVKTDILRSLEMDMPDFEDAVVAQCAKRLKAEYIITRNARDFRNSPIPPITPENFLNRFSA